MPQTSRSTRFPNTPNSNRNRNPPHTRTDSPPKADAKSDKTGHGNKYLTPPPTPTPNAQRLPKTLDPRRQPRLRRPGWPLVPRQHPDPPKRPRNPPEVRQWHLDMLKIKNTECTAGPPLKAQGDGQPASDLRTPETEAGA